MYEIRNARLRREEFHHLGMTASTVVDTTLFGV